MPPEPGKAAAPGTPQEALARLRALEASLPADDGVKWFTRLYAEATDTVVALIDGERFLDGPFMAELVVEYVAMYLDALEGWEDGRSAPRGWRPLLRARRSDLIAPIQFALAGMNAHVNRDLAIGLVAVCERRGLTPQPGTPQHRDFQSISPLLEETQERVKAWMVTGLLRELDRRFGRLDDITAAWSLSRARDAAWLRANVLWALRASRPLADRYVTTFDRSAGMTARLLLVPTRLL
jgi:hypothetical protein